MCMQKEYNLKFHGVRDPCTNNGGIRSDEGACSKSGCQQREAELQAAAKAANEATKKVDEAVKNDSDAK